MVHIVFLFLRAGAAAGTTLRAGAAAGTTSRPRGSENHIVGGAHSFSVFGDVAPHITDLVLFAFVFCGGGGSNPLARLERVAVYHLTGSRKSHRRKEPDVGFPVGIFLGTGRVARVQCLGSENGGRLWSVVRILHLSLCFWDVPILVRLPRSPARLRATSAGAGA